MATDLKALEEAINNPDLEITHFQHYHCWGIYCGKDEAEIILEAARKYLSIQRAVEVGKVKIVQTTLTNEMKHKMFSLNIPFEAWNYLLQSAPEFSGE